MKIIIRQKALKFLGDVRRTGIPVAKAYLFGSHAKGKGDENSDIDICVVSKELGRDYFGEMVKLRKIALETDYRIEPVPFTPADLQDPYSTLAAEIREYGIRIS